jgi:hypothetical protein
MKKRTQSAPGTEGTYGWFMDRSTKTAVQIMPIAMTEQRVDT